MKDAVHPDGSAAPDLSLTPAFLDALFRYADPDTYCALRVFPHERGKPPPWSVDVRLGDQTALLDQIGRGIHYAATSTTPTVFSPATGCTFRHPGTAKTKDLAEGLALAVELDQGNTAAALARLEAVIGLATVVVRSGGEWSDPQTGEVHAKRHAYWRLSEPTRDEAEHVLLYTARQDAARLTGADPTGAALAHCYRWPGSLNRKKPGRPVRCTIDSIDGGAEIHLIDAAERLAQAVEGAGLNGSGRKGSGAAYHGKRELQADPTLVAAAMACIPNPDAHYNDWVRLAYAVAGATGGTRYDILLEWSRRSSKHHDGETNELWDRVLNAKVNKIGAGTIFYEAAEYGWIDPRRKPETGQEEHLPDPGGGSRPPPGPPPDRNTGSGQNGEVPPDPNGNADGARLDERPQLSVVICEPGKMDRMYRETEAALLKVGAEIYQRTILVKPAVTEYDAAPPSGSTEPRKTHSTALIAVTAPALAKLLSTVAIFMKFDARKKRNVLCDPPPKLVDTILASRGDWLFPVVRGVLTTPTLRPDGSLLMEPGYDPISRYFVAFPSNLVVPKFPDAPTRADAEASLARLDRLLDGYDFVDDGGVSRSVALAMLMTQVLRCAMPVSPLLAVSATAPGTGKSHLVDLASTIAIGRWCSIMNAGKDDNETEKGINTKLISGVPGFSIDNVHRKLDLEALNTATERPLLSPRNFGTLTDIEVENGAVVYMTGNNLAIIGEQRRRTMLCRMDAAVEEPEQRPFASDPIKTVLKDRGRYIADVLIIARAFITNGSQQNIAQFGSFPDWSRFVREPLCWLGQPDPLLSQKAARENDPEINQRRDIIDAWHGAFGMAARTLAAAVSYATTPPVHPGYDRDDIEVERAAKLAAYLAHKAHQEQLLAALREAFPAGRDGINTHSLGNWIRRFSGRLTDGLKFVKAEGQDHGVARWKLSR